MIETEQSVAIAVGIDGVWGYARNISNWANLMPGLQEYTVSSDDDSYWTLKVGVGGLVRTVKVFVHVDLWDGPGRAIFTYKLQGDPVKGGGSYAAVPKGPGETDVKLQVRVEGSGPMAPMWEAMGRPLLPQLAKIFAGQLKAEIEKAAGAPAPQDVATGEKPSRLGAIVRWLRRLWRGAVIQEEPR
jgi:carbon monoxide dehydrogenase subunit G